MSVIHYTPWQEFADGVILSDGQIAYRIRNMAVAECGHPVYSDPRRQTIDPNEVTCKSCMRTLRFLQDTK